MEKTLAEMPCCVGRPPRRVTALLTAVAARASAHDVERWAHWLRVGRANAHAPMEIAARGAAVVRALEDARAMRDSRLHALLAGLEPETRRLRPVAGDVLGSASAWTGSSPTLSPVRLEVTGEDLTSLGAEPSAAFSAILAQALADRLDGVAVGREAELANLRRLAARRASSPRYGASVP